VKELQESVEGTHPGHLVVVIFGASGDLTSRKIVPALYTLISEGSLSTDTKVLGMARSALNDKKFRHKMHEAVREHSRLGPHSSRDWRKISEDFFYFQGDYDSPRAFLQLKRKLSKLSGDPADQTYLFYLATPPTVYPSIIRELGKAGLTQENNGGKRRIIIEKPFGKDLNSSNSLNKRVYSEFHENQVFRIDHYLGKETVQNILTFRFANTIFEPIWNRNYIDNVQITAAESVGVEHRAGYYDKSGVGRDMLQNHLLQLVALIAMEPPIAFTEKSFRDEKVNVLKSLHHSGVEADCVWGQYDGYTREKGIPKDSRTPTFVALKLFVRNWRWEGIPFYVRTGKKLRKKTTEVIIQFKRVPLLLFPEDKDLEPNRISICIEPDEGLHLRFESRRPGMGMETKLVNMTFHYSKFGKNVLPLAYERLLLDAVQGDPVLFARNDEISAAWSFVDPIITAQEKLDSELHIYQTGSWGPNEATSLLGNGEGAWQLGCSEKI
jgi:glucose-6-phosphate 1-dehydrogenase